jgi:hypothetical protein
MVGMNFVLVVNQILGTIRSQHMFLLPLLAVAGTEKPKSWTIKNWSICWFCLLHIEFRVFPTKSIGESIFVKCNNCFFRRRWALEGSEFIRNYYFLILKTEQKYNYISGILKPTFL